MRLLNDLTKNCSFLITEFDEFSRCPSLRAVLLIHYLYCLQFRLVVIYIWSGTLGNFKFASRQCSQSISFLKSSQSSQVSRINTHFDTISRSHADSSISHALALSWYQRWSQISKLFLYLLINYGRCWNFYEISTFTANFKFQKFFGKQSSESARNWFHLPSHSNKSQIKNLTLWKTSNLRALPVFNAWEMLTKICRQESMR